MFDQTKKNSNRKSKHFQNLLLILLELELAINLSPKLTKAQMLKIKRQISTFVKTIKL
jgi:hypothetical protein